jgi:hypothetical protein
LGFFAPFGRSLQKKEAFPIDETLALLLLCRWFPWFSRVSSPSTLRTPIEKNDFSLGIPSKGERKETGRKNLAELGEDEVGGVGDRGDALGALLVEGDLELLLWVELGRERGGGKGNSEFFPPVFRPFFPRKYFALSLSFSPRLKYIYILLTSRAIMISTVSRESAPRSTNLESAAT